MRPVSLRIRSSVGKRGSGGNFLSFFNENAITRELPLKAAICLSGKSDDFAYLPITARTKPATKAELLHV